MVNGDTKPFSICAFMSFITEKNNYESSSPAFANLWLLLVYNVTGGPNLTGNPNRSQPDPNPGQLPSGLPWAEGECNRNYCKSALWSMRFTLTEMELTVNVWSDAYFCRLHLATRKLVPLDINDLISSVGFWRFGVSLNWSLTVIAFRQKRNAGPMQTGMTLFGRAKTTYTIAKHVDCKMVVFFANAGDRQYVRTKGGLQRRIP